MKTLTLLGGIMLASSANATMVSQTVTHTIGDKSFESTLVFDDAKKGLPAILMVPNWMGPTEGSLTKAKKIAEMGYAVMMADVYGTDVRPSNADEAKVAATALRSDRPLLRARTKAALDAMKANLPSANTDADRVGAIGFCFGGGAVLELARAGEAINGVVSFHGNLDTPNPTDANNITSPVLVLHGAIDPFVPAKQVADFEQEMSAAKVDWQFVAYGGAVHSFTNPAAAMTGKAEYHPKAAARSFIAMDNFFAESFN
ncbi:DeoR family transcriptional regulator [Agarivorans sp. Toyoura001]|uniref:dienelactone hydrolase family protein n=1 Tax=Agarivorans sp. Toyoura001 TaxID=2283141 RepID=UPI0010DF6E25|nr:dienelactone hydrolase family protein [Agarivorans sp. Toyoura001]GDY25782.1 DeoR family transcriptional regulator [Agarivorans sp. Toyoura001]